MRRKEDASAFIIALGILVILFIMAITFATMMIMESRAARNYNDAALCEDVAYGALEEAINALFRDKYGEDASVVAGSLVLQPYNEDAGDENYDYWGTGAIPEDSGSWPGQGTEGNEPFSDSASNTVDLNGDGTNDSKWIYRSLPAGLLGRYAILITDDREARVNVNTAGNLAVVGPMHGSNMGASVTEVSLEALLGLFYDRDGNLISAPETLAEEIILARCAPPDVGSTLPGDGNDDDGDDGDDGVDNNGDGEVDESGENVNEDDEFNSLFAVEDTPFALPDEAAILASPADTGDVSSSEPGPDPLPSLTDNTKSWTVGEWIGATVGVDTDTPADGILDVFRSIIDNDPNTLTVNRNWVTSPAVDNSYAIYYGSPLEGILDGGVAEPHTSLRAGATGTAGLTLADCLTTYSAGTIEHPYIDTGQIPAPFSDTYRRYRFGLNQFDIDTLDPTQVDDLTDILENSAGFTNDQAYQFIVNLKDALDGDSDFTAYPVAAPIYYGVESGQLIYINEVFVQDLTPPGEATDPTKFEYAIELYNCDLNNINIEDWVLSTVGLGVTSLDDFPAFSAGTTIASGEHFVISNFNPAELALYFDANQLAGGYGAAHDIDYTISGLEFRYDGTGTATGDVISLREDTYDLIIDKAAFPDGITDFETEIDAADSIERSDYRIDDWTETVDNTLGSARVGGYLTDGPPDRFHILTAPMTWYGTSITYDMNFANLGDLGRLLLVGLIPDPITSDPTAPALSQYFNQVQDNLMEYEDIKFDPAYYDSVTGTGPRVVLDYLTILNPMGDGYDDDGDGTADDTGPTGLVPAGADDLGGPEHRIPGMININTASEEVLMALPGVDATLAQAIIDNRPYADIGELLEKDGGGIYLVTGIDALATNTQDDNGNGIADEKEEEFLIFGALSNIVTTRSNVFTVYCLAQVGVDGDGDGRLESPEDRIFAERELMAIVDRSTQPINVRFQRWLTD